jgi:antirestriction protein
MYVNKAKAIAGLKKAGFELANESILLEDKEKAVSLLKDLAQSSVEPRVYVGTYAKYNDGSLKGKWLNLNDYADHEEFMEACRDLHKDENDPEIMFQDYEGFPDGYYNESSISAKLWDWLELDDEEKLVVEAYQNEVGAMDADVSEALEAFQGTAESPEDWAMSYIDDLGGLASLDKDTLQRHLYLTPTDIRVFSVDEANAREEDLNDKEVLKAADMDDDYYGAETSEEAKKILRDAREKINSDLVDEISHQLEVGPVRYFLESGLEIEDIAEVMSFDYKAFAEERMQDYNVVDHDGKVYIFRS